MEGRIRDPEGKIETQRTYASLSSAATYPRQLLVTTTEKNLPFSYAATSHRRLTHGSPRPQIPRPLRRGSRRGLLHRLAANEADLHPIHRRVVVVDQLLPHRLDSQIDIFIDLSGTMKTLEIGMERVEALLQLRLSRVKDIREGRELNLRPTISRK